MGSGNDSGSDSNPYPRGRSSLYMVGAAACDTVAPTMMVFQRACENVNQAA